MGCKKKDREGAATRKARGGGRRPEGGCDVISIGVSPRQASSPCPTGNSLATPRASGEKMPDALTVSTACAELMSAIFFC